MLPSKYEPRVVGRVHRGDVTRAPRRRRHAAIRAEVLVAPRSTGRSPVAAGGIGGGGDGNGKASWTMSLRLLPAADPRVHVQELRRRDVAVLQRLEPVLHADVVARVARVAVRVDAVDVPQVLGSGSSGPAPSPAGSMRSSPLKAWNQSGFSASGVSPRQPLHALAVAGRAAAVGVRQRGVRVQALEPFAVVPVLPLRVRRRP